MVLSNFQKENLYILDSLAAGIYLNVDEIFVAVAKLQKAQQRIRNVICGLTDEKFE